jgi:hypothetical protein
MYGNQILKNTAAREDWLSEKYKQHCASLHKTIKSCHHFYFGDYSEFVDSLFERLVNKPFFMKDLAQGIRLPYSKFLLCVKSETMKYAVLIQSIDIFTSGISVNYFCNNGDGKKWMLLPCTRIYMFNKNLIEASQLISETFDVDISTINGEIKESNTFLITHSTDEVIREEMNNKDSIDFQKNMGGIINYFLILYNQKYIVTETIEMNKPGRKLKKNKTRLFSYKILCVKLPKSGKKYRYNSSPGESKGIMPYTEVPGKWKTYTEDAPLFGNPKLVGEFWVPAHVRGSKQCGFVGKDYHIKH